MSEDGLHPGMGWADVSGGIVADMLEHPSKWMEWPISGDALTKRKGDSLIHLVDWESMSEDGEEPWGGRG